MEDRAVVERQLGRPPRAFHRVVVRCPFGMPAVTEQTPYDDADEPFPTTYYVTCPFLVAAISRLEAAGGVERWSERVATDPELAESLQRARRVSSATCGESSPAPRKGATTGRRSSLESAVPAGPSGSSASTRTRRSPSRALGTRWARACWRKSAHSGRKPVA